MRVTGGSAGGRAVGAVGAAGAARAAGAEAEAGEAGEAPAILAKVAGAATFTLVAVTLRDRGTRVHTGRGEDWRPARKQVRGADTRTNAIASECVGWVAVGAYGQRQADTSYILLRNSRVGFTGETLRDTQT